MSYLVFARKYRPGSFGAVVGQEHVTRTLMNSIRRQRVAHAYLFAGPRGVGKTSIARVFSRALNCANGPSAEPCLECPNCQEIARGTSLAVREIDGASHNSVDNVRDLIDSFRALPAPGYRYKIYIIDEVHMLSGSAFNALLKSLEEPPPNTVFILATTESHKIPETVISRCQRHDFRALSPADIEAQLRHIAGEEKLQIESEVFRMIARLSDGSMRDSQSLLDRVCAFCEGRVTAVEAGKVLGVVERGILFRLSQAVFAHQPAEALSVVAEAFGRGIDPALFLREFAAHWRELLVARFGGTPALEAMGVGGEDLVELQRQAGILSPHDVQDLVQLAREGADTALRSAFPKYALEALVVRLATREEVRAIGEVLERLRAGGGAAGGGGGGSARPEPARPARSAPAAPVPQRAVGPDAGAAPSRRELDWGSFVRESAAAGGQMLSEQLKRLSVGTFSSGVLEASGPDFTISYLNRPEHKARLGAALEAFSGQKGWKINLRAGQGGGLTPGSILAEEEREKSEAHSRKTDDIVNHPGIKNLQKIFPGSTIEAIRIKE